MERDHGRFPVDLSEFPDLSRLAERHLRIAFAGRAIIGALPAQEEPARSEVFNLVRLAEKSGESYSACRTRTAAWIEAGVSVPDMMRAIDDAETCINSTHRGFLFAEALRRARPGRSGEPVVNRDMKNQLRAARPLVQRLRDFRDAIEHRDADLASGTNPGAGAYVVLRQSGLHLGEDVLAYGDLASLISRLHEFTCEIVTPEETHHAPLTTSEASATASEP